MLSRKSYTSDVVLCSRVQTPYDTITVKHRIFQKKNQIIRKKMTFNQISWKIFIKYHNIIRDMNSSCISLSSIMKRAE